MSKQLSILKKSLGKIVLKNEILLLNKWIYKNKNQHRRADYFHKIVSVQRHWKRFIAINLSEWIREYNNHHSQDLLKEGCFKLFYSFALLQKMQSEITVAYVAFRRQVELTYFMAVSLFAMGILARMQYLIHDLLEKIQDTYHELKDSSLKLPNVISLQEFINWNMKKDDQIHHHIDVESTSSSEDNRQVEIQDKSVLSEEFWSKPVRVKSKRKATKKDELDEIFKGLK